MLSFLCTCVPSPRTGDSQSRGSPSDDVHTPVVTRLSLCCLQEKGGGKELGWAKEYKLEQTELETVDWTKNVTARLSRRQS